VEREKFFPPKVGRRAAFIEEGEKLNRRSLLAEERW